MIKAGLVGTVLGFIYVASLTLVSPFCTFCFTPLLGIGIGYLAAWFDKPPTSNASVSRGIVAGGMTGVGVFLGQILATVISTILITNLEQLPALMSQIGLADFLITDADEYWQATLTTNSLCSLMNWGIIIGSGGLGGMYWFQRRRGRPTPTMS